MTNKSEEQLRTEAKRAAKKMWRNYEELGDRLDDLQRDHGDEDAREAFRTLEDLAFRLDDAHAESLEAVRSD